VDADVYFFIGRGGIRLFDGLYATAGVRRISLDLAAALTLPTIGTTLEGDASPGFWDPLVGVDWRKNLGTRLRLVADFQGGGFGVGTDVDLSADAYLDWHFARHFDLRLGYSMFYYKATIADVHIGSFQRTLVSTQTLHSPTIGLGIVF
jgi:hypothetical protein